MLNLKPYVIILSKGLYLKIWRIEKYGEYALSDTLYENAVAGPCVIVGRCADYILQDVADCLTVFVHASDAKRAERIVSVYGQREESPVQRLHDKDRKRRAYYELYTGTQWGRADNYDLCLDSGKIGINRCVSMIVNLYQATLKHPS